MQDEGRYSQRSGTCKVGLADEIPCAKKVVTGVPKNRNGAKEVVTGVPKNRNGAKKMNVHDEYVMNVPVRVYECI